MWVVFARWGGAPWSWGDERVGLVRVWRWWTRAGAGEIGERERERESERARRTEPLDETHDRMPGASKRPPDPHPDAHLPPIIPPPRAHCRSRARNSQRAEVRTKEQDRQDGPAGAASSAGSPRRRAK
jgi:hypothetical protein